MSELPLATCADGHTPSIFELPVGMANATWALEDLKDEGIASPNTGLYFTPGLSGVAAPTTGGDIVIDPLVTPCYSRSELQSMMAHEYSHIQSPLPLSFDIGILAGAALLVTAFGANLYFVRKYFDDIETRLWHNKAVITKPKRQRGKKRKKYHSMRKSSFCRVHGAPPHISRTPQKKRYRINMFLPVNLALGAAYLANSYGLALEQRTHERAADYMAAEVVGVDTTQSMLRTLGNVRQNYVAPDPALHTLIHLAAGPVLREMSHDPHDVRIRMLEENRSEIEVTRERTRPQHEAARERARQRRLQAQQTAAQNPARCGALPCD